MCMMKKNIGIILAGGYGSRMGSEIPKQFLPLAGKTILEHTLSAFEKHAGIDEIAVVTAPAYEKRVQAIKDKGLFPKFRQILYGGAQRYQSTFSALTAYAEQDCNLLIHDAARPLVSSRIIGEVIAALEKCRAVNVAIPVSDTVIETDAAGKYITGIPRRDRLFLVQTPQGFDRQTLRLAFGKALQDPDFHTTDDCSIVKKYLPEEKIRLVRGEPANIKITWPEDLEIAEKLLTKDIPNTDSLK